MSLRTKLLLVSLLTLILPWAGWKYAQQMETTLRRAQEDALLTTAQVLSRVVASEPELCIASPICAPVSIRRAATCSRRSS